MEMACASRPYTTGCSLWQKCRSGVATGTHCKSRNVLANMCSDEAAAGTEGCRRYRQLCPSGRQTAERQCSESTGIENFLQTADAIEVMMQLCTEMPGMPQCDECTSRIDPTTNCKDALASIAGTCLDHYMEDCKLWYEMCKTQPAGLDVICGTSGERPLSDAGNVCYGQMRMYFHGGLTDFVLFDSWVPLAPSLPLSQWVFSQGFSRAFVPDSSNGGSWAGKLLQE
jgi:copper transporter 1